MNEIIKWLWITITLLVHGIQGLGYVGELPLPTNIGDPKCVATSIFSPYTYLIYSSNKIVSFHENRSQYNITNISDWPDPWGAKVSACILFDNILYITGNGMYSILSTTGQSIFHTPAIDTTPAYTNLLLSSYTSSKSSTPIYIFYAFYENKIDVIDVDTHTSHTLSFSPTGGYCLNGYVYLYAKGIFVIYSEISLAEIISFVNLPFINGGVAVYGSFAYFITVNDSPCDLKILIMDVQHQYNILEKTVFLNDTCDNSTMQANVLLDESYMYLFLSEFQAIYKFAHPISNLTVLSTLSEMQIVNWVELTGLVGSKGIVGFRSDRQALHRFSRHECGDTELYDYFDDDCSICQLWTEPPPPYLANYTSCPSCAIGYYATAPGVCTPCENGTYTNSTDTYECPICPLRYYPSENTCKLCPAGTYASNPGECKNCTANTYSFEGSLRCLGCVKGFYITESGCEPCPVYSYGYTAGECRPCPTATSPGATTCDCSANSGFYLNQGSCLPCLPGSYGHDGTCEICGEGTISVYYNSTSCTPCAGGTYSSSTTSCSACQNRFYAPPKSNKCYPCPAGTKGAGVAASNCTKCEEGSISSEASEICFACPLGTIASENQCQQCDAGSAPINPDGTRSLVSCFACPANTMSAPRDPTCSPCPNGQFSGTMSSECKSCYNDLWNKSGVCTPVAQISIGILVPAIVIVVAIVVFLRHRKSKAMPVKLDNDGVALVVFSRPPALNTENSSEEEEGEDGNE